MLLKIEEYHPCTGTTSFKAGRNVNQAWLRHYRFTGKQRDEESGLEQ